MTLREMSRGRPPVPPKNPIYRDSETEGSSDQESVKPKSGIMAKVSKFEKYARQHHCIGRSQFYTPSGSEISPKVFSANSLTVNTPAKDVLGGRPVPENIIRNRGRPPATLPDSNDGCHPAPGNCPTTATNNDDRNRLASSENPYGRINAKTAETSEFNRAPEVSRTDHRPCDGRTDFETRAEVPNASRRDQQPYDDRLQVPEASRREHQRGIAVSSSAYDRNPQYSPVYSNPQYDRSSRDRDAETMRIRVRYLIHSYYSYV